MGSAPHPPSPLPFLHISLAYLNALQMPWSMLNSMILPCLHFIMKSFLISSLITCASHQSQQAPIRYSGSESFSPSLSQLSGFHLTLLPCQLSNGQSSSSILR